LEKEKCFLVPPDLSQKLLIFGMTVPELCAATALFFFAAKQLTLGRPMFSILPCAALTLFVRALDGGGNALGILFKRFRYYMAPQTYSIRGGGNGG